MGFENNCTIFPLTLPSGVLLFPRGGESYIIKYQSFPLLFKGGVSRRRRDMVV
jgi:hypothetical protein